MPDITKQPFLKEGAVPNWSREETQMAFVLYMMLPPSQIRADNEDVVALAQAIGRSPNAVKAKLYNIAAHDVNRTKEGHRGLSHGSTYDVEIWEDFAADPDTFLENATNLLSKAVSANQNPPHLVYDYVEQLPVGKERTTQTTQRINQAYFRNTLLKNYGNRCCVTGMDIPQLLIASHIKPWKASDPATERLAASNGLLLNALHDKAFDQGLITLDKDYRIVVSNTVSRTASAEAWLHRFAGEQIALPQVMPPDPRFIEYHNDVIFKHA